MLPFGSLRLGKIFGIEIELNYTWFIIFVLIFFGLSIEFFPSLYPFQSTWVYIIDGLVTTFLFFGSVLFHELSHSLVAKLNNLPIKKITLFIFGGVAQMSEEPQKPQVELIMAIAGPFSSFLLAGFFGFLWLSSSFLGLSNAIVGPVRYLSLINLFLGIFNLAPGFPLDGGRVLRAGLWYFLDNLERATRYASWGGQIIAFTLILIGFALVIRGMINGIWLILIGMFLNQAAQSSYRQLLFQSALSQVKVEEIMTKDVKTVSSQITLDQLVNDYFLRYKFGRFPIIDGERLLGVIGIHDVKEIPREKWSLTTVGEVVPPLKQSLIISPKEEASRALIQMTQEDVGHLSVVSNGKLVGLVTRSDILRLIKVKTELGMEA